MSYDLSPSLQTFEQPVAPPYAAPSCGSGSRLSEAERRALLRLHGSHATSSFHLQDGVEFFDLPGVGFLAYARQRGLLRSRAVVFAPPVCAEARLPELLDGFLTHVGGDPLFAAVDGATAAVLQERGYTVNDLGVEYNIPLQDYAVRGRRMRHLKSARNLGGKGVEARELSLAEVDLEHVDAISEEWRSSKAVQGRELRLITRPPSFAEGDEVRRFFCFVDGRLTGFAFFEPFYRDGAVIGYCANILRAVPGARPNNLLDFTVLHAMDRFREEGVEWLSLGLSPLHEIEPHPHERTGIRRLLEFLYRYGNGLYEFQDLALHKTRYRAPVEKRLYGCIRGRNALGGLLVTMRAVGVL